MDTPVSCPVCTLYLREGVSLQAHLNTHPKDQVIDALLKFCSPMRDGNAPNDIESVLAAQYENQQSDQSVAESVQVSPQQQYPCGSSHFTAAVTYQQFMSSNASVGGTVLPQCFSVPAIITTPAGEAGQATLMPLLYNPYVIQQQQQQLQFYNAFRTVPQQPLTRQILSPAPLFPVSPQFSVAAPSNPVFQNNVSASSSSSSALQNGQNVSSNSAIYLPSITNGDQESNLKCPEKDQAAVSPVQDAQKFREGEQDKQLPVKRDATHCTENQESGTDLQAQAMSGSTETVTIVLPAVYEDGLSDQSVVTSLAGVKHNSSDNIMFGDENCAENMSNSCSKSPVNEGVGDHENNTGTDEGDSQYNPVSPSLRVRTDLSRVSTDTRDSSGEESRSSNVEASYIEEEASGEREGSPVNSDKCVEDGGWGFLSESDKGALDISTLEKGGKDSTEYITCDLYPSETPREMGSTGPVTQQPAPKSKDQSPDMSARHFKVVDIEGIHVLVPSHFLSTEGNHNSAEERDETLKSPVQQSRSGDLPANVDSEESPVTNQDIQTDEVMPALGELSGQESIGENDTNSWSQEKEDISTSYDLLAREKWEASDGSDDENDSDLTPGPAVSKVFEPPVQIPLASSNTVEDDEHEQREKSKKKEKLKCSYKCWTCDQVFTCPKERRVHQSEKHAVRGGLGRTEKKMESPIDHAWHDTPSQDSQPDDPVKQEHKNEQNEESKISVKTETELLPVISDEMEDSKTTVEALTKPFSDDCVKDIKHLEEQPRDDNNSFKFVCSRCEGVFASAKSLHRHVRTVHGQSQFTCRTCAEKFPTEVTYLAHLKIHPLECSRCGKYFYRHQNLNLHIRRHLGIKPFKCSICDKAFVTKQKLAEHTNTHTGNTPIKCNLCTETFRRYSNLIQHKNRHHLKLKKKVKDFICHCGEVFHSQKKLQWHKEIHDEKPKTCTYCSERFVHASSLTRHIRKAHDQRYFPCQGRENENVECPICGCVFLKSSLPVHMRLHSGERPFNCHICGKNFSTKWNLQLHRWTHASRSLKPYKCSLCKSAFIRHSEYTSHMHSHRNVRPYTCNYCGSQFIRKYNCIRHAREHEGEKPFSCNICQKSFHRRYYLKEHMRIHSGLRPFTCHICGKTSSTKSNHNKHVKIHHAREAINTEG